MLNTMLNRHGKTRVPEFHGTSTQPTINRKAYASALNN